MINRPAFQLMSNLVNVDDFDDCISVSEQKENTAYKSELVLRFLAQLEFVGSDQQLSGEFGTYLTEWMKRRAEAGLDFLNEDIFRRTFAALNQATGGDTFRRFDGNRHLGSFSISGYEFITSGVAHSIDLWEKAGPDALAERVREVWSEDAFRTNSGTGISSRKRFPRMVNLGRDFFRRP